MKFLKKLKGTILALLPILVIVLFVHLFLYRFDSSLLKNFIISLAIAAVGEALLLTGIDSTIMPMGELMVNSVINASRLVLFVVFALVFGTFATIAEPDVSIFSDQVILAGITVPRTVFIFLIGAGVGVFIALGIIRLIKNIDVKYVYLIIFAVIFLLCTQVPGEYIAIAFDAGGATTGIITAPFLLSVSMGITNKFSKEQNKEVFGMVGMASLGPIIAVLLMFVFLRGSGSSQLSNPENLSIYVSVLKQTSLAIIPLAVIFLIYDLIAIKLPIKQKLAFLFGLAVTFTGLYLFLFSIDFGISSMGAGFGQFMQSLDTGFMIVVCIVIGFIITFSEPSVVVLSKQVQTATKGNISSGVVLVSIAISMSLAILISALKILYNINFFYIILVGYLIALALMFFVPSMFTGLAFDSGGVASGPMTSAFLLPIMIELASHNGTALSGFGLIGIVGMSPIVVIQILGLIYKFELKHKDSFDRKRAIKVSFTADMYSNIQALESEYKLLNKGKNNEEK